MTQDMGASASADRAGHEPSQQAVSAVPVTIPSAELASILRRAADLIEPEGAWTQGAFSRNADGSVDKDGEEGDPDGVAEHPVCWCALGAIATAAGHDLTRWSYPLHGPVHEAQRVLQEVVGHDPPTWNDYPGRKQDEVVAALREAAQAIEARRAATSGAVHESAVAESHAPTPSPLSTPGDQI